MRTCLVILTLIISTTLQAQVYEDYAPELFFGRQPSARTAAMGRILVLNYDQDFVSFSNPANLSTKDGLSVFYSHSSPYYGADDLSFNFIGTSYNFGKAGSFAFNFSHINYGYIHNEPLGIKRNLFTLTYARSIGHWFNIGINANLYKDYYEDADIYKGTFFELGVSKYFEAARNNSYKYNMGFACQVKNIFNQSAKYEDYKIPFPSIFRIGMANEIVYNNKSISDSENLLGLKCGFEYQNVLNSKYRTAYKVGTELAFLDMLFLRAGYFTEEQKKYLNSVDRFDDFTYGFGVKLDFNKYLKKDFPLTLSLDYVDMEQPSYVTDYTFENFTTFNMAISYKI